MLVKNWPFNMWCRKQRRLKLLIWRSWKNEAMIKYQSWRRTMIILKKWLNNWELPILKSLKNAKDSRRKKSIIQFMLTNSPEIKLPNLNYNKKIRKKKTVSYIMRSMPHWVKKECLERQTKDAVSRLSRRHQFMWRMLKG